MSRRGKKKTTEPITLGKERLSVISKIAIPDISKLPKWSCDSLLAYMKKKLCFNNQWLYQTQTGKVSGEIILNYYKQKDWSFFTEIDGLGDYASITKLKKMCKEYLVCIFFLYLLIIYFDY